MAAAAGALLPVLMACNAILGLSDYERGECPGAYCGDGSTTLPETSIIDASSEDARPDVKGASPVSWAKWRMPNYDGGAVVLPNPLTYEILNGDEVRDTVTDLVWRRAAVAVPSEAAAEAACSALGSWRVPKRIELVTLLDYGRGNEIFIDPVFTGVKNDVVWTSSERRPLAASAADQRYWTVSFGDGTVGDLKGDLNAKALCVKSAP